MEIVDGIKGLRLKDVSDMSHQLTVQCTPSKVKYFSLYTGLDPAQPGPPILATVLEKVKSTCCTALIARSGAGKTRTIYEVCIS